ncbi:MAG TPA: HEAT repeat domain-containing protein [Planctomycetota bacterium]|nr:HEAT repeat domain-containing protein [Planctomycetota bacterium]
MRPLPWLLVLLGACSGPEADTHSKDPYERYLGLKEIAENRDVASESEVVRLLDDPHFLVVTGALEVMAAFGRKDYLPYALPKLQVREKEKDRENLPMVRSQACLTVATCGQAEGLEPILGVLRGDPDLGVRRAAVKVLADRYGKDPRVLQALVDTVGEKDPSLSYMAHLKLCELTGRQDVARSKAAWGAVIAP